MGKNLDELSRNLARGIPRRKALAIFAGGIAAATMGRQRASAQSSHLACDLFCAANFGYRSRAYFACLADCSPCTTNANFAGLPCPRGTACITLNPPFVINYTTNYSTNYVVNSYYDNYCAFSICVPSDT